MKDGARFFAYSTWAVMISLGIIIFTHPFFQFMSQSNTTLYLILLGFGFLYFNLTFIVVKRYIKKVPVPTNIHILLSFLVFIPPTGWIVMMNRPFTQIELLLFLILILASVSGTIIGNRAGIKARYEYIQKLKKHQKKR